MLRVGGEERWVAAEDAGLYRDALGAVPPGGLPAPFLEDVADAMERLVRRFARTHGPFEGRVLKERYGLDITPVLAGLERAGELVRGELRPGGTEREWCDPEVLRRLRRASLAALRAEIEPADQRALARFLPSWQGVDRHPPAGAGIDRLREALVPLQGLALPAEIWERDVLPRRIGAYSAAWLDQLCASGEVVWVGAGALGRRSGKVALYFREDAAVLGPPAGARAVEHDEPAHTAIRTRLAQGACFFTDLLVDVAGIPSEELQEALWDLVWAGEVTNDAFAPLRSPRAATSGFGQQARADRARRRRFGTRRDGARAGGEGVQGRWSLTAGLFAAGDGDPAGRRRAQAELLLERYGIVTREHVLAEGIPGGFSSLYDSLASLETIGVCQRGYFVEGLGGAQFALPGAAERLRAQRDDDAAPPVVLAATDPAQPYGAALKWPKREARSPARQAGAHVVLAGAEPVLYVERGGKGLQILVAEDDERLTPAIEALTAAVERGRIRRLALERVDGEPVGRLGVGGAAARARLPRRPEEADDRGLTCSWRPRRRWRCSARPAEDPGVPVRPLARARRAPPRGRPARAPRARARREALPPPPAWRSRTDPFRVPGMGRSRNVVGMVDTPRDCLFVLMAHADTVPPSPGAEDNASGVGTLVALAPELAGSTAALRRLARGHGRRGAHLHRAARPPRSDRARPPRPAHAATGDLRWALSLDEVGRGRALWLRSPRRRGLERKVLGAAAGTGLDVRWVADAGEGLSDHREFTLAGEVAAKLGVPDNPARHTAADVAGRLTPRTFPRVRALLRALVG